MKKLILPSLIAISLSLSAAATLQPYQGEPPRIQLNANQLKDLSAFKPVYPPLHDEGNSGGGVAVFRVKAPKHIVAAVILDFPNYTKYNGDLYEASYYKPRQGNFYYLHFVAGNFLYKASWHVKHNFPLATLGWGTWELDKNQANDLSETIGFWRIDSVQENPNWTDVSYSVNLEASGFILNMLKPMLISSGIQKATQWVKEEAQRRAGTN